jgi:hypothetical protein
MKVVFHADDFGLTRAVNAGILQAHQAGLLRSTSLIVTASAAQDAAAAAQATPSLDVGLHLTLIEERPVLPASRIPSLVDGGRFWPQRRTVGLRYLLRRWDPREAREELAAQWDRFAAFGLAPSHCDGHQHLHLLPAVFPSVVAEARRRGVRFVRTHLGDPISRPGGARPVLLLAVRAVSELAWRRVAPEERASLVPFTTIGFLEAGGRLTTAGLLDALDRLRRRERPPEIVEVILHPGQPDPKTQRAYAHWRYHWERDLALLLDPSLPEALSRRGIEVSSFRELGRA